VTACRARRSTLFSGGLPRPARIAMRLTSLTLPWALALAAALPAQANPPTEERLAEIFAGEAPASLAEARAMQDHVQALLARVLPATVSLPGATGVLIEGGLVLTAGHVTEEAGKKVRIELHDGRQIEGVSLGLNRLTDTGLVRVTTEGEFPTCSMGRSADLDTGQWCLMLGHASGAKPGRSAPARLGRVLRVPESGYLVTDCTMQGGDSGGPLFDMDGRIVGINSRISRNLAQNMHVPIDAFHAEWDALLAGKVVGEERERTAFRPLGLRFERATDGGRMVVREVVGDSRAEEAGFEAGDRILKVDGKDIDGRPAYSQALRNRESDQVLFEVQRGEETLELEVELPRREP
jgi:serine protease Do